jgi:hypothetical protein
MLGDADLLTRLLAAGKVKHPLATANALLAEFGSFAEALAACRTQVLVFVRADNIVTDGDGRRIHDGCP